MPSGLGHGTALLAALASVACSAPAHRLTLEDVERKPPGYDWRLPPGFPPPRVPPDNPISPAKVELGRRLFYDVRLSADGDYACASCHRQELAFTDGLPRAVGTTGELHPRGSMSLVNAAYNASLAWADPGLTTLERQARVPMFNERPVELGLSGVEDDLLRRLRDDERYAAMFAAAFPGGAEPVSIEHVIDALASFVRTIISADTPYHRLVFRDERGALSDAARRGMALFSSERLRCAECHFSITLSGPVDFAGADDVEPEFHNTGLYNVGGSGDYPGDNPGLFEHTGKPADMGAFRAPTLYNIALTAPYMHDGSLATLGEVIDFYAAGGRDVREGPDAGDGRVNPHKSPLISGFEISEAEKRDLIAFLESLTDTSVLTDPRFSNPFE